MLEAFLLPWSMNLFLEWNFYALFHSSLYWGSLDFLIWRVKSSEQKPFNNSLKAYSKYSMRPKLQVNMEDIYPHLSFHIVASCSDMSDGAVILNRVHYQQSIDAWYDVNEAEEQLFHLMDAPSVWSSLYRGKNALMTLTLGLIPKSTNQTRTPRWDASSHLFKSQRCWL